MAGSEKISPFFQEVLGCTWFGQGAVCPHAQGGRGVGSAVPVATLSQFNGSEVGAQVA